VCPATLDLRSNALLIVPFGRIYLTGTPVVRNVWHLRHPSTYYMGQYADGILRGELTSEPFCPALSSGMVATAGLLVALASCHFGARHCSSLGSRQNLSVGLQPVSASLRRCTPAYASCGDRHRDCAGCTVRMVHACGLVSHWQRDIVVAVEI
jgi:hypothetical protein